MTMMIKNYYFLFVFLVVICSCNFLAKKTPTEKLTEDFYDALNNSNFEMISQLHYDSVRVKEADYLMTYAPDDYINWLRWDSVFSPSYKILALKERDEAIEIMVSKECKRTLFLNGSPVVTKERLRFKEGKIYNLEIVESTSYDNENWNRKREELVEWVNKNHPELNGFIHDQTKEGGMKYLKALALYKLEHIDN